jgi:ABC-2 type transport system permease protein
MRGSLGKVLLLGVKELRSLRADPVLLPLILYAFSFAVYSAAEDAAIDVRNAAVAIVDEDRSTLSRRLSAALAPPWFQQPETIAFDEVDPALETGRYTFVLDVPPDFERDVLAGEQPTLRLDIDATAMSVAGRGASYIQTIVQREVARFLGDEAPGDAGDPVRTVIRVRFNPNLRSEWFQGVIEVVNNITILAIILAGAAVIREREHGTLEHLLVMPVRPSEIMLAKVWANGLVILVAALTSLVVIVRGLIGVPIAGSLSLFAAGTGLSLFSVTALGIFLATLARSMPQFGLLAIPAFIVMILLSGSYTPLESMPTFLQWLMLGSPSTWYTEFAKSVLSRGADIRVVWPELAGVFVTGAVYFAAALVRFRASVATARG